MNLKQTLWILDKTLNAHGERHGDMLKVLKHSYTSLKTDIEMHLEKDLHEHIHLENNILFPKAGSLEEPKRVQQKQDADPCG